MNTIDKPRLALGGALRYAALLTRTTGSNNIPVGYLAGHHLSTCGSNIAIGNDGMAGNENEISIGVEATPPETTIAGIYGNSSVSALPVVIDSNGQLGTVSSSEHFKTDIAPMYLNEVHKREARIDRLKRQFALAQAAHIEVQSQVQLTAARRGCNPRISTDPPPIRR